ncbi:hypothetical protein [uncultured Roseibium sp.]|uniref:hypothetical protein n=1 Tax=uncultured Roseibium sp. TaxID=1936171 RepID=UPI00262F1DDA|nr:hypothetical protein [uncultured Roseibium sp.]
MQRTDRQQIANKLDLDMFNLAGRLRSFGEKAKDRSIIAAANRLEANRNSVREYMHRKDRDETPN